MLMLKVNLLGLKERLNRFQRKFIASIEKEMFLAVRLFESKIIKEQMSGRVRENFGLKRQSGRLRSSWTTQRSGSAKSGNFVVLLRPGMKYAKYHQFEHLNPSIPKRLYVLEDFKISGHALIHKGIRKALENSK